MKRKKIVRWGLLFLAIVLFAGGGYAFYLWNMPHRDVQATSVDYEIEASVLVKEYLADPDGANQKYLNEDGDSKVLVVTGTVWSVEEDMNRQKVLLLKTESDSAGVSCTFMDNTNMKATGLKKGENAKVKGVIRSGAGYDEDLEFYENVILEKCDLLTE